MNITKTLLNLDLIKECFKTDEELCSKFHIEAPNSIEICAKRTYDDLKKIENVYEFYKIENEENLIGWFGIESEAFLTGFFINPEYRNKNKEIFKLIKEKFKKNIICGIYDKNIRAEKFLKKLGATQIHKTENGTFYHLMGDNELCL